MLPEYFVIIGFFLSMGGCLHYLIATLRGTVQPNRVSWFLWASAPLIAFAAELSEGVGIQSLMTLSVGLSPLLVFLASFVNRKSVWKLQPFDYVCGGLSVIGIILWAVTRSGNVAIIFSIAADSLASIPTIRKSFTNPESESYVIYLLGIINAILTILTLHIWNIAHIGYPIYIITVNSILVAAIIGVPLLKKRTMSHT